MTRQEIRQALSDKIQKDGIVYLVGGALGELQGCSAYVEHTLKTPMWRTKYFGVSYWFKGITDNDIIDRVTITKRAFFEIIKLFPFFRIKRAISSMHSIYICEGGLKTRCLKYEEFCPFCQELVRIGSKLADKDEKLTDLVYCFAMFLQFSPTYRVWIQDISGEINKENFEKRTMTEILRLKRIFMIRLRGTEKKANYFWKLIFLAVFFNKKLAKESVRELNIEKVKLDEADWYFCLRRNSYDFGGKSLWDRVKEAAIIDDEKGNLILGI